MFWVIAKVFYEVAMVFYVIARCSGWLPGWYCRIKVAEWLLWHGCQVAKVF